MNKQKIVDKFLVKCTVKKVFLKKQKEPNLIQVEKSYQK